MATKDRRKQVKTTKLKYGKDHYKIIGQKGGLKNPVKFNSETARAAAQKRWDKVRNQKGE